MVEEDDREQHKHSHHREGRRVVRIGSDDETLELVVMEGAHRNLLRIRKAREAQPTVVNLLSRQQLAHTVPHTPRVLKRHLELEDTINIRKHPSAGVDALLVRLHSLAHIRVQHVEVNLSNIREPAKSETPPALAAHTCMSLVM